MIKQSNFPRSLDCDHNPTAPALGRLRPVDWSMNNLKGKITRLTLGECSTFALVPRERASTRPAPMNDVTRILSVIDQGDPQAAGQLLPLVYDELRRLADHRLAREAPGQTLQATALVHEAYLRLIGDDPGQPWEGRGHFFAAAAEAMRRILVESARRRRSQ
jgi:hypothetical protein